MTRNAKALLLPVVLALASCETFPPMAVSRGEPVLHYVRSNSDGSEAETVVMFISGRERVEVFKGRERCTSAAYVTATLSPLTGSPREIVGGRLTRELTQQPQAWMTYNLANRTLTADVRQPGVLPVTVPNVDPRWRLYDFDFADLIAAPPPAILRRGDFAFDLPLVLVDDSGFSFTNRGRAELTFEAEEARDGRATLRYYAGGPAFDGKGGMMWFDAATGRLVEAKLGLPNHNEYRDFHLKLVAEEDGASAWRARLARHWEGCA